MRKTYLWLCALVLGIAIFNHANSFTILPSSAHTVKPARLEDIPRPIRGTVHNASNSPIGNATVVLSHSGTTVATTYTDSYGNFSFDPVMPGTYTLDVSASGYSSYRDNVSVVDADVYVEIGLTSL